MAKMTVKEQEAYLKKLIEYGDRIKSDKSLVDSILKEHLCNVPHKKLYKFRTCSNQNFKTLEENCIWMPPANTFKDTFDCTINIDFKKNMPQIETWLHDNLLDFYFVFVKDFFESRGIPFPCNLNDLRNYTEECVSPSGKIKSMSEYEFLKKYAPDTDSEEYDKQISEMRKKRSQVERQLTDRVKSLVPNLVDEIQKAQSHLRDTMLVYCMTERFDNHNLWETYANNYSGFCIEYCFDNFEEKDFDIYKNLIYLLPMIYKKNIPHFDMVPFIDIAMRKSILHEDGLEQNPDLLVALNMQVFYKNKDYESEHEWRFSIANKNNCKQPFPFVSGIYAGKDIKPRNLQRLINIAGKLGVPIYCQVQNRSNNGYNYIPTQEVTK